MNPRPRSPLWLYPIAFGAVIVFGHLFGGWVDMDGADPGTVDHGVNQWVASNRTAWPNLTKFALFVTQLGNPEVATTAILVIAGAFFLLHLLGYYRIRTSEAIFWLAVAGGGRLLSIGLKLWFRRDRPPAAGHLVPESTFSFPSGHGMFAGEFFLLIAILVMCEAKGLSWRTRPLLVVAGLGLSLSVAASRVWLGVHYVSDVVAGFLIGAIWVAVAVAVRYKGHLWVGRDRHPPAPSPPA